MRKLLNTLYVLSEDAFLTLDGENVVIKKGKEVVGRFPLHTLENIITFSYQGATPAFMGSCAEKKIGLVFLVLRVNFWRKLQVSLTEMFCSEKNSIEFLMIAIEVVSMQGI